MAYNSLLILDTNHVQGMKESAENGICVMRIECLNLNCRDTVNG